MISHFLFQVVLTVFFLAISFFSSSAQRGSLDKPNSTPVASRFFSLSSKKLKQKRPGKFKENAYQLLVNTLRCKKSLSKRPSLERHPSFYTLSENNNCTQVSKNPMLSGDYFTDSQCRNKVKLYSEKALDYCLREFDVLETHYGNSKDRPIEIPLGKVSDLENLKPSWTFGYTSTIPQSVWSNTYTEVPLLSRQTYKVAGKCHLEMRVYKKASYKNGIPLMVIHGGGWEGRSGTGHFIESQISHFTEAGFVVYMPFYRLINNVQAGPDCHGYQIQDSVTDLEDAFLWVLKNNKLFTQSHKKIRVLGQSAGGHMAISLALSYPQLIHKIVPMYGMPDFPDALKQLKDGLYKSKYLRRIFSVFLNNKDFKDITGKEDIILDNELLTPVENRYQDFPKVFAVHGTKDDIVPFSQSTRLCNALSGNLENGPVPTHGLQFTDGLARFNCGNLGGQLVLLENENHHFDVNCNLTLPVFKACFKTKKQIQVVSRLLKEITDWLKED